MQISNVIESENGVSENQIPFTHAIVDTRYKRVGGGVIRSHYNSLSG